MTFDPDETQDDIPRIGDETEEVPRLIIPSSGKSEFLDAYLPVDKVLSPLEEFKAHAPKLTDVVPKSPFFQRIIEELSRQGYNIEADHEAIWGKVTAKLEAQQFLPLADDSVFGGLAEFEIDPEVAHEYRQRVLHALLVMGIIPILKYP